MVRHRKYKKYNKKKNYKNKPYFSLFLKTPKQVIF